MITSRVYMGNRVRGINFLFVRRASGRAVDDDDDVLKDQYRYLEPRTIC